MVFAASGENLFETRCGAKDFFDKLCPRSICRGGFFHTVLRQPSSRNRKVASSADAVLKDCTVSARPSGAMSTAPSPATPSRRRRTVCPSGHPAHQK